MEWPQSYSQDRSHQNPVEGLRVGSEEKGGKERETEDKVRETEDKEREMEDKEKRMEDE